MLTLPSECRGLLKEPFGSLHPDFSEIIPYLNHRVFCTVGDVVTQNAFLHGLTPDISVIDGFTKRLDAISLPNFSGTILKVKNPAGCISEELTAALSRAYSLRPALVLVDGEEDLGVLPLIEILENSAVILYGQPDEGVVFCEITQNLREKAAEILSCFIKS